MNILTLKSEVNELLVVKGEVVVVYQVLLNIALIHHHNQYILRFP